MTEKEIEEKRKFAEKRSSELTDELIELISKSLVEIADKNEFLKHFYEELGWDAEASYTIEDGLLKLGIGLGQLEVDKRDGINETDN